MSVDYTHVVIETYPDGTTWKHYFPNKKDAAWAMADMKKSSPARRYELVVA